VKNGSTILQFARIFESHAKIGRKDSDSSNRPLPGNQNGGRMQAGLSIFRQNAGPDLKCR